MSMEGEEGWLLFSSNEDVKESEIPQGNAELGGKSQSERIKAVLYKLYMQDTNSKNFIGSFESYYQDKTEKYIQFLKDKINEN